MADVNIQTIIASMDTQMKVLEQLKLFNDIEINAIKSYRNHYGIFLSQDTTTSQDILLYIRYELDILAIIRMRKVDECSIKKKKFVTMASANLLNRLLYYTTEIFPKEIQLWCLYIKYCQEMKDNITLMNVIKDFLKAHQDNPCAFQLASRCARENFNSIPKARNYLISGISIHLDSQELYKEIFLMELQVACDKYVNAEKNDPPITEKGKERKVDPSLIKPVEYVYRAAVAKIRSTEFFIELLNSIKGFPFAKKLESRIRKELLELFPNKEIVWDTLAKAKLDELKNPNNKPNFENIIKEVIKIYITAVKKLNTPTMWGMYIDRVWELYNDSTSEDLLKFKKDCMIYAFVGAYYKNQLGDKDFLCWADLQIVEERKLQLLKKGTDKLPNSVPLWKKLISNRLEADDENEAWLLLKESLVYFHKHNRTGSLPIWKMIFRYYLTNKPDKVEWFFTQALSDTSGVAKEMKVEYLEWVILSHGITAGRELYDEIARYKPYSMGLHNKMMDFENIQVKLNVKLVRKIYSLAAEQFGRKDISVWMRWIRFENRVPEWRKHIFKIRARAKELIHSTVINEFNSEMRFFEIECLTSAKPWAFTQKAPSSLGRIRAGKKRANSSLVKCGGKKRRKIVCLTGEPTKKCC